MRTVIRCERKVNAEAIAKAFDTLYPSYRHEATREKGYRVHTIRVYCRATGALLLTRAEG